MATDELMNQIAEDSATDDVSIDKLGELSRLCCMMRDAESVVEEMEEELKKAKSTLYDLQMIRIPDVFDEIGLSQIKLLDGAKVEIKRSYAANISQDRQFECFEFLRKNGHESIIKHDVTAKLKKGDAEEHEKIVKVLMELGTTFTDKEFVHPMTLKAFVKEQIEKGADFPQEVFGVHPIRKTSIK